MKVKVVLQTGVTEELLQLQRQYEYALSQNQEIIFTEAYFPEMDSEFVGKLVSCSVQDEKLMGVLQIEDATLEDFTNRMHTEYIGELD